MIKTYNYNNEMQLYSVQNLSFLAFINSPTLELLLVLKKIKLKLIIIELSSKLLQK